MKKEIDYNHIALLLHIIESANPNKYFNLKPIHDKAMAELDAIIKEDEDLPVVVKPIAVADQGKELPKPTQAELDAIQKQKEEDAKTKLVDPPISPNTSEPIDRRI